MEDIKKCSNYGVSVASEQNEETRFPSVRHNSSPRKLIVKATACILAAATLLPVIAAQLLGCSFETGASDASPNSSGSISRVSKSITVVAASGSAEDADADSSSGSSDSSENSNSFKFGVASSSAASNARSLYQSKVEELVNVYGAPAIVRGDNESYVTGVAVAALADFGAERDSLLVAYCSNTGGKPAIENGSAITYQVEVWDAGFDGGNLVLAYNAELQIQDGPSGTRIPIAVFGKGKNALVDSNEKDDSSSEKRFLGFNDGPNGPGFGKLEEESWNTYRIGGDELELVDWIYFPLSSSDKTGYTLHLGLEQPENELEEFGIAKPSIELVPVEIKSGNYSATTNYDGYNPLFSDSAQITEAKLADSSLVVTGCLRYRDTHNEESAGLQKEELLGPAQWTFKLNDETSFYLLGGANGPREVDKDGFSSALNCSIMGLMIDVVDGYAVSVGMSS